MLGIIIFLFRRLLLARKQIDRYIRNLAVKEFDKVRKAIDVEDVFPVFLKTPDERLMERIINVVSEHMCDQGLTVEKMAFEIGISRVHLHRKMKELTGQTPSEFILHCRLDKAAEMLTEKDYAISELADILGFRSASSFSSAFKAYHGVSPSKYVKY